MRVKANTIQRQNRLKMKEACKLSTFILVNEDDISDFIKDSDAESAKGQIEHVVSML